MPDVTRGSSKGLVHPAGNLLRMYSCSSRSGRGMISSTRPVSLSSAITTPYKNGGGCAGTDFQTTIPLLRSTTCAPALVQLKGEIHCAVG